jgi:uncharacterized Zn finger protein (UPF0148 family)
MEYGMAKRKTADKPKFADQSQRERMLVRECPQCHKFHHPRAAKCPNCEHEYAKKSARKKVVKKPAATNGAPAKTPNTAAARSDNRLQAGIDLVVACKGDLKEARSVLETIEQIRKL